MPRCQSATGSLLGAIWSVPAVVIGGATGGAAQDEVSASRGRARCARRRIDMRGRLLPISARLAPQAVGAYCLGGIFGDAPSQVVHEGEITLGRGIILIRGETKPAHRLDIVLGNTASVAVKPAKVVERLKVA